MSTIVLTPDGVTFEGACPMCGVSDCGNDHMKDLHPNEWQHFLLTAQKVRGAESILREAHAEYNLVVSRELAALNLVCEIRPFEVPR